MKKISLLIIFVFSFIINLYSENTPKQPMNLGVYGALNFNLHNPSFTYRSLDPLPFTFDNSVTSIGGAIGGIINIPINEMFVISGRIGYHGLGTKFEGTDTSGLVYSLDNSVGYLEISPTLGIFNLIPIQYLYLLGGLEFGLPLTKSEQFSRQITTGVITQPVLEIPDAGVRMALILGAGYIFKLSPKLNLTPEVSFRIPFTEVSSNTNFRTWDIPQFRIGAALTFNLSDEETKPEEEISSLKVGFKEVRYYDAEGNKFPLKSIKLEDVQYTELYPLVPYVFFGSMDAKPAENEQVLIGSDERGEFTMQKLEPDALKINTSTLDIIGSRLRDNPNSELTITGTLDGGKKEKNNTNLGLERAEFAKNYLVKNYNINPELVNIRSAALPAKASTLNDPDGVAENRRVELTSTNSSLFDPIVISSENQRLADPSLIEFIPYVESTDSIVSWNMEISQSDRILRKNNGAGSPPPMQWGIHPNELTNKQIPIDYKLFAENSKGLKDETSGSIPIEYYSSSRKKTEDLPDMTISKFSLILFDFDKSDISEADMKIIENNIIPAIKFNSTVKIYGYTDRIGDEKYNLGLSMKRAETVKSLIQAKMKDVKISTFGVGENNILFDNELAVGRQLSRTVQVLVSTPK